MAETVLSPKFREWLKSLIDERVEFLLVGGFAVIAHGYLRYTGDIGFWISVDPSTASRVYRLAERLGEPIKPEAIQMLQTEHAVIRFGESPYRIDIMTSCDGCDWSSAWSRRVIIDIDGLPIPVISLQDLKAAKRAAGRHKDLDDLENLPDESLI